MKHLVDKTTLELSEIGKVLWSGSANHNDFIAGLEIGDYTIMMATVEFQFVSQNVVRNVIIMRNLNNYFRGTYLDYAPIGYNDILLTVVIHGNYDLIQEGEERGVIVDIVNERISDISAGTHTLTNITLTKIVGVC